MLHTCLFDLSEPLTPCLPSEVLLLGFASLPTGVGAPSTIILVSSCLVCILGEVDVEVVPRALPYGGEDADSPPAEEFEGGGGG